MLESITKIGEAIDMPIYELVIEDHIPFVDPAIYKVKYRCIDPAKYFITSGDAVEKTKVLERDLWHLAAELRKACAKQPRLRAYERAVWKAAGKARSLLHKLKLARGTAIFFETEWSDHILLCIPKNPRSI